MTPIAYELRKQSEVILSATPLPQPSIPYFTVAQFTQTAE